MNQETNNYCAIFGDIVRSRSIENRAELQDRLIAIIKDVNRKFADDIIAPFRIIAGDEVRGLLRDASRSYDIITSFQEALLPERMRFAVGIGEISTSPSDDINIVDGPALHRATELMSILKNQKRSHKRTILFASDNLDWDRIINSFAWLLSTSRARWSRADIDKLSVIKSSSNLEIAAKQLGISPQAITKLLDKTNYRAVVDGEEILQTKLLTTVCSMLCR